MSRHANKEQKLVHVLGDYQPPRGWRIASVHPVNAVDHVTRSRGRRWSAFVVIEKIEEEQG